MRDYRPIKMPQVSSEPALVIPKTRKVIGADIFVEANKQPAEIGPILEQLANNSPLKLKMISNRGTKVYPAMGAITDCVDQHRCRFVLRDPAGEVSEQAILDLLDKIGKTLSWVHVEKLQQFDGADGFTKAQGED